MKMRLYILIAFVPILMSNSSCATGRPIPSLCIFDFDPGQPIFPDQKICWVNKDKDKGFTLKELLDEDFFGLSGEDLRKVFDKLNECKAAEPMGQSTYYQWDQGHLDQYVSKMQR